jgi:hypothetical protein
MELVISRLKHYHQGLKVIVKENETFRPTAIINGNEPDFFGPIILLSIDQHTVYGLSYPEVISRILVKGPQSLITTKEMSHNLFEHGMKASLGKLKINNSYFLTTLETFYTMTNKASNMSLILGKDNQLGIIIQPRTDLKPILISNYNFTPKEIDNNELIHNVSTNIEIDSIRTHVVVEFKPDGYTTPK